VSDSDKTSATRLLTIHDLRLRFGTAEVLRGVSLHLQRGEALGLVGESGSGKTTTALSVIQLLSASAKLSGSIRYHSKNGERELVDQNEAVLQTLRGREIGMVFQDALAALNPVRTIASQLEEVLHVHQKLRGAVRKAAMLQWLREVGIESPDIISKRYPHQLSGGQRQRIMIALALACEPELLICDEPTSALDVTVQKQVIALLRRLRAERGLSILFISHDLALTAEFCDRIAVMRNGEIAEIASADQIWKHPQSAYTQGLLACRPNLHSLPDRLLTVADFENGVMQVLQRDHAGRAQSLLAATDFLQVRELSAWYPLPGFASVWRKPTLALQPVNFSLKRGIVGESGSGKTTLARCLVRLHSECSGELSLAAHGHHPWQDLMALSGADLRRARRRFQMVFQDPYSSLNPARTIAQCLHEPLAIHGLHQDRRDQRLYELLDAVSLPKSALMRYPSEFSGGQRQRIAIARALAVEPELLICDESVSALDVSVQAQILNLLRDLQKQLGLTLVFISHDLSVIRFLADQMLVMAQGRVVEQGACESIFGNPQHAVTRALLEAVPKGL
jgi:peptide/nickel transport system ATP-binding protein